MPESRSLFVCYVPGLDRRRIDEQVTPYIHSLLNRYPWCRLKTIPTTELTPTLLSGVGPDKHHFWQVSLKDDPTPLTRWQKLYDRLPDVITTTVQCFGHFLNSKRDLAAVPWRRRRQFNLHRMKYTRRETDPDCLNLIGGYSSILNEVGPQEAGYIFCKRFEDMENKLPSLPRPGKRLDFAEFYGFDLYSHWHLDRPEQIRQKLRYVDGFIKRLHEQCEAAGVTMILLVDHGQERIRSSINLLKLLKRSGVPREEYVFLAEVSAVRFWFHTQRARERITELLRGVEHTTIKTFEEMHDYGVCFDDRRFGELYCFADHGYTFFPHDFYNPLANLFLGLTDPLLRPRLINPRHRGNHGHLPTHPAEEGYVVLCDDEYRLMCETARLTDFAPSVMALLGRAPAEHMTGRVLFEQKHTAQTACSSTP